MRSVRIRKGRRLFLCLITAGAKFCDIYLLAAMAQPPWPIYRLDPPETADPRPRRPNNGLRELIGDETTTSNLTGVIMAGLLAVSYWGYDAVAVSCVSPTPPDACTARLFHTRTASQSADRFCARWVGARHRRLLPSGNAHGHLPCGDRHSAGIDPAGALVGVARRYVTNFAAVIIAVVVFVPLGRFMIQYPDDFWSRASGRLFGDSTVEVKDPATGSVVSRVANTQDRLDALRQTRYLVLICSTPRLMFNWSGDSARSRVRQMVVPQNGSADLARCSLIAGRVARLHDPTARSGQIG
jgi:hypothetical protein